MKDRAQTPALSVDCPLGHATAGHFCNDGGIGHDVCQPRINAAAKRSRTENIARRAAHKPVTGETP